MEEVGKATSPKRQQNNQIAQQQQQQQPQPHGLQFGSRGDHHVDDGAAATSTSHHIVASVHAHQLEAEGRITAEESAHIRATLQALDHDAGRHELVENARRASVQARQLADQG